MPHRSNGHGDAQETQVCVILRSYFIEGLTVKEITLKLSVSWWDVRDKLREVGISLADEADLDPVASAVRDHGFASFDAFVRVNGLEDMTTQARLLGVSHSALTRSYDAYGKFIGSTTGGSTTGDTAAPGDHSAPDSPGSTAGESA